MGFASNLKRSDLGTRLGTRLGTSWELVGNYLGTTAFQILGCANLCVGVWRQWQQRASAIVIYTEIVYTEILGCNAKITSHALMEAK